MARLCEFLSIVVSYLINIFPYNIFLFSAYGLVVHGIEDGGRAARDGRLRRGDHIKTINGIDITQETFDR